MLNEREKELAEKILSLNPSFVLENDRIFANFNPVFAVKPEDGSIWYDKLRECFTDGEELVDVQFEE